MIDRFKIFCAVAETRSFSKASQIVHLSQPAVTLQIQSIEELFETKLFERAGNAVKLTASGEVLYKYAKEILKTYTTLERDIGKITGMIKGGVSVGASSTIGNYILPKLIIDFKKSHPKIKINLHIGNTKRIEDLLISGFIDFGLIAGEPSKGYLKTDPLLSDELLIAVPPRHIWAKKKVLSIFDLIKEPFIMREEGSGTRQKIEDYLEKHGLGVNDLRVMLVLGSTESIKEAVEGGIGISIISKWAARKEVEDGRIKLIEPKEGRILRNLSMLMPRKAHFSHAAEAFFFFVKNYPYKNILRLENI
jgi:molybdate transport repressor ModE-like protein